MQLTHIRAVARKTILFITGFWLTALLAQGQNPAISQNIKEEKAVLQTERELLQAFINGDGDALNRLLADNYRSSDGFSKHEIINDPNPMSNTSFDTPA